MKSSWKTNRLKDVAVINYGYTDSASFDEVGPRFLRITDIQNDQVDWKSVPFCKIAGDELSKFKLIDGDIVFARTGATTGKSFLVKNPPLSVFASYLIRLRLSNDNFLPEYIAYFFQTAGYWSAVNEGMSGSAQGGFNATKLGELSISYPTYSEQKRIVAILDEAFAGIATAKANAEKNLQNARELFEGHLQAVFSERGEGWVETTLGEIGKVSMCKRIFKEQTKATGDIPFYKIGTFGKEPDSFIPNGIYKQFREKYSFPNKGDVLISAAGTIGRRIIYDGEDAYFQDSNIVWIANDEKQLLNHYLYHFYGACEWNSTTGATISRLYNDNLRSIKIRFPKLLSEQQYIAKTMDALFEKTQRLETIYQQKITALDELKKALLHKAFSGEL